MTSTIGKPVKAMITDEGGLTLIELCFVILILGLILATASPHLSKSYHKLKLKTTAEKVHRDLMMASRRATLSAKPWRIRIWDDGDGYDLEERVIDYDDEQPVWDASEKWQLKFRRIVQEGLILQPEASTLVWSPAGQAPDGVLTLRNKKGDEPVYEIRLEKGEARLYERQQAN